MGELEAGFAKLQGEDFEYYMQTYSIILGRNSKKSTVDVDLASLGGGMNISRQHARIYYDFDRKRFALEVIGKNGCFVEGVLYLRGTSHVKLDSQDLLQIGEKKFYFLLPTKRICKPPSAHEAALAAAAAAAAAAAPPTKKRSSGQGKQAKLLGSDDAPRKESKKRKSGDGMGSAFPPPATPAPKWQDSGLSMSGGSSGGPVHAPSPPPASGAAYSSGEVREVVAAIGSVLSDLCGPGEWMPIAELFSELQAPEHYSNICSPAKLWRVVESENEDPVKPWAGLLALLRRYPEHFIINIKSKGHVSTEYVSLVSLVS